MIFVDNEKVYDPRVNLAIEEYLIRNVVPKENILLFYINEPSIIIGRNQNTVEEINVDYVEAHDIHVVRRLSGGGAVYHDYGNLNFSFIAPNAPGNFHNFQKFTQPVIDVLRGMGVPAELSGRNDIVVEGRKISGNAQYVAGPRMVSHGTLLWKTDLHVVGEALRVKSAKIESKGIKSVRSRVANITEYLSRDHPDIMAFRQRIIEGVFGGDKVRQYRLNNKDWEGISQLAMDRYQTWEWNYGRSPAFGMHRETRYAGGGIDAWLDVEKGRIQQIRFRGDFFGQRDVSELENHLKDIEYHSEAIMERLKDINISDYFINFTTEQLLDLIY
ncbi:MAG: lipoate--protein ligase [Anaerolineaceae bacterium]|jgi:lipoate-protein ligase A